MIFSTRMIVVLLLIQCALPPVCEAVTNTPITTTSLFAPGKAAPLSPTFMTSFTPTLTAALARAGMVSITTTARSVSPPPAKVETITSPASSVTTKCDPTKMPEFREPCLSSFVDRSIRRLKSSTEQKHIETQFTLKAVIEENNEVGNICPVESSLFAMQEPILDSVEINEDDTSKEHFCKVRKGMRRIGKRVLKLVGSRPASPVRCENCATPIKRNS